MTIHVDIVSAETAIFSGTCEKVFAPAVQGEIGVMPRHSPLLTQLNPGEVRVVKQGGEEEYYYVSGGMIEVQPHHVTVLADTAIRAKDVDEAAALEAKSRAEQTIKDRVGGEEYAKAAAELAAAVAQIHTLQRLRQRTGIKG
jgi:F-type H+-transporting ATPase subunit epsilon